MVDWLNRKIGITLAIFIALLALAGVLYPFLSYYLELERQHERWYKTHYFEKGFKGVIKEVGDYDYNEDFHKEFLNITITTGDTLESEIHYGMLSFKKEPLLKTIHEGDSIFKNQNALLITIKKSNGRIVLFEL